MKGSEMVIPMAVELGFDEVPNCKPVPFIKDITLSETPPRFVALKGDFVGLKLKGHMLIARVLAIDSNGELLGEIGPFEDPYTTKIDGLSEGDLLIFQHVHVFHIGLRQ